MFIGWEVFSNEKNRVVIGENGNRIKFQEAGKVIFTFYNFLSISFFLPTSWGQFFIYFTFKNFYSLGNYQRRRTILSSRIFQSWKINFYVDCQLSCSLFGDLGTISTISTSLEFIMLALSLLWYLRFFWDSAKKSQN